MNETNVGNHFMESHCRTADLGITIYLVVLLGCLKLFKCFLFEMKLYFNVCMNARFFVSVSTL